MTYFSYIKLWKSEFDNIVSSEKDKTRDVNINQPKLEVHDTYEKGEKRTTNFTPVNDEDVVHKPYLDEKLLNIDGQISYIKLNLYCLSTNSLMKRF